MRVLIATAHFSPRIGGLEEYVLRLATGLQQRHGHEVVVVTTAEPERVPGSVEGVRVIEVPILFTASNTPVHPAWPAQMTRILRAERPDVINTHAPVPGLPDVVALVRGRCPLIATYHAGTMKKGRGPVDAAIGAYEATLLRRVLRKANAVVGVHPTFVPRLVGADVPVERIPPGVDLDLFHPGQPAGASGLQVLYVGRIEHSSAWKGIGTLLEAMATVIERHPDARLSLVGTGDAVPYHQEAAARLGIAGNVEFRGVLRGRALADAYRSATVLALPSETDAESFGMVIIEALASGTPVVASRVGGVPALVERTGGGLLVPPRDAPALGLALRSILEDSGRRDRLAREGATAVRAGYSWDATADRYDALMSEVVGSSNR